MKSLVILIGLLIQFLCTSLISQEFSTLGDIYNFDPGDKFQHIHYNCCNDVFYQLQEVTILERHILKGSIQYFQEVKLFSCVNTIPPILTDTIQYNRIDTLTIFNSDSIIFNSSDEIILNSSIYNNRKICNKHSMVMGKPKIDKYVNDCGLAVTTWLIIPDSNCRTSDSLVYFKKGREIWGDNRLSASTINHIKHKITVYPNPVSQILNLKFPYENTNYRMIIYDISGRQLSSWKTLQDKDTCQFDMSQFKKGVYLLHINNSDRNRVYRIIKY